MSEARLARPRPGSSADDRSRRRAVMRCPERSLRDQRPLGGEHTGYRVDPHHLERLPWFERGQDRRQPASEHRLARSRRAGEQQVVPTCGGELERAASALLAAHVGQVEWIGLRRRVGRLRGRRTELAAQVGDGLGEVPNRNCLDAAELGLAGRLGRTEDPPEPGAPRPLRDGERAAYRSHATVQRELADRGVLGEPVDRDLPRGGEDRQRDREVEAGALLA